MIIIPIYVTIDTDDEDVARALMKTVIAKERFYSISRRVSYELHAVEHRGESPVMLRVVADDPTLAKTYVPVPGLIIRKESSP